MSKKVMVITLSLLMMLAIGLSGCGQQAEETGPPRDPYLEMMREMMEQQAVETPAEVEEIKPEVPEAVEELQEQGMEAVEDMDDMMHDHMDHMEDEAESMIDELGGMLDEIDEDTTETMPEM